MAATAPSPSASNLPGPADFNCDKWADCSCSGVGRCGCGTSCGCGSVSIDDVLKSMKADCAFSDCGCGSTCHCGQDCKCGGSKKKVLTDWVETVKAKKSKAEGKNDASCCESAACATKCESS